MKPRTILISGASIAGPALAFWLRRYGLRPVVVERAPQLRLGGQNIDVRGAGRVVARRMGIEADIRAATTGVFGDHIVGLRDSEARITASFASGDSRDFDLVIVADGIRSRTRTLVFGDEPEIRELGLYTAYLTIPRVASDDAWWRWYNAPGGRTINLRPDNVGTTRATLSFMFEAPGYERLGADEQKQILRRVFRDAGWQAPRVLAALDDAPDLYFEAIGQVRAPRWSRGRVGLVGDAAYCASPISGMGTSLALAGAYVLAGALARHEHHGAAFAAYEAVMRPYVDRAQQLPPGAPRLAHPKTRAGIALLNAGARLAARVQATGIARKMFSPPADELDLPDDSAPWR